MALIKARSQTLFKCSNTTTKVALINAEISDLFFTLLVCCADFSSHHQLHLTVNLTRHCFHYILTIDIHQTSLSWVFCELSLKQFKASDVLSTLL